MNQATKRRIDWEQVKKRFRAAQRALEQSSTTDDARMQEIFRQRAERLAVGQSITQANVDSVPVLVFKTGEETYGIELRHVAQVFPGTRITPVPGSPETLLGIANLDGEVRSVLGLRSLLGRPDSDDETNHYVLLLRRDGRKVGLRIEQIEDVRQVAHDSVTIVDDVADQSGCYVHGVTRDNLIMLRMDALFEHSACQKN